MRGYGQILGAKTNRSVNLYFLTSSEQEPSEGFLLAFLKEVFLSLHIAHCV